MAQSTERRPSGRRTADVRSLPNCLALLPVGWHLLSLDASTVAALWCWCFARAAGLRLPWGAPLLLATGAWLLYVVDRLLDSRRGADPASLRERHFFYARHRTPFFITAVAVAAGLLWLVATRMNPAVRHEDVVLSVVAMFYFLLVHLRSRHNERWLPKELAVGVLFAAATAVPTWARIARLRPLLAVAVALFAALCWLNCAAIEHWERTPNHAAANVTKRLAGRHLRLAAVALAAVAGAAAVLLGGPFTLLEAAVAASALLLGELERRRGTRLFLRVAADAALLTPVLVLPWLR